MSNTSNRRHIVALLEGVNKSVTDNNKSDLAVEESTVSSLESSDNGDRHPPEPSPAFTPSPPVRCTYCNQSFTDRTELISDMDKESAEAIAAYESKRMEGL